MSHFCSGYACMTRIPADREFCPDHTPIYQDELNGTEYLQKLPQLAENIATLIAGSKLTAQETAALAYIQGYLEAAKIYVTKEGDHEPVQP